MYEYPACSFSEMLSFLLYQLMLTNYRYPNSSDRMTSNWYSNSAEISPNSPMFWNISSCCKIIWNVPSCYTTTWNIPSCCATTWNISGCFKTSGNNLKSLVHILMLWWESSDGMHSTTFYLFHVKSPVNSLVPGKFEINFDMAYSNVFQWLMVEASLVKLP